MTPMEKYSEEKDELKNSRMNRILESAFELFSLSGIDTIAMTDIAKKAEIGVASLYRYFATKDEIAIRTAIWAWEKQKQNLLPSLETEEYRNSKGIIQLDTIFHLFLQLYENQTAFLRFIYFFDSYAVRTTIEKARLADYEKMIESVQIYVAKAIHKGIEDNSINSEYKDSEENLYFTLMHTFFSMVQKFSLSETMLKMDEKLSGKVQIELLSKMLIKSLQ